MGTLLYNLNTEIDPIIEPDLIYFNLLFSTLSLIILIFGVSGYRLNVVYVFFWISHRCAFTSVEFPVQC